MKVAKGSHSVVNPAGGRNLHVTKNMLYEDDDAVVLANPSLFEDPSSAARRQAPITSTEQLGNKSMSSRKKNKIETTRQAPGQGRDESRDCPDCDFVAKTKAGLAAHRRRH